MCTFLELWVRLTTKTTTLFRPGGPAAGKGCSRVVSVHVIYLRVNFWLLEMILLCQKQNKQTNKQANKKLILHCTFGSQKRHETNYIFLSLPIISDICTSCQDGYYTRDDHKQSIPNRCYSARKINSNCGNTLKQILETFGCPSKAIIVVHLFNTLIHTQ